MSQGQFWQEVRKIAKATNEAPVMVGQIITLIPFVISFQGVDIGASYGDTIYINPLLLDENINLDLSSMDSAQNFNNSTAYQSPNFTAEVSGTQKQFLADFYNWTKAFHDRFILHEGDYAAVQKLGNNTYLVLEKVNKIDN